MTLVIVGSILGLAVGYGQAVWDKRSKRNDPNYDEKGRRIDVLPPAAPLPQVPPAAA